MIWLCTLLLTTFISVNGQLVEVAADSEAARAYAEEAVTDIGDTSNYIMTEDFTIRSVSSGDTSSSETVSDYSDMILLLSEQVELLAENSSTVTGTLNTSVLELMDRIVDSYPSFYKYAGFRTSSDDTYTSTLYVAKKAVVNGNTITFSSDCVAVSFYRTTSSSYSSYIYYTVTDSPGASVTVDSQSIVYTNVLDGYPSLGNKSALPDDFIWIGVFVVVVLVIFLRRNSNG